MREKIDGLPPLGAEQPMNQDEGEGEGEAGGAGGQSAGSRLVPVFKARIRAAANKRQEADVRQEANVPPQAIAEGIERIRELDRITLENDYEIAFYDGFCVLYDEKGRWVGEFPTEEEAIAEAFRRRGRPDQQPGIGP